jgi:quinoprotein glucose dehydrogenase
MTRGPAGSGSVLMRILLLALLTWACLPSGSQSVSGSWPMVNLDSGAMRYSPLAQITPENVRHLKVAWVYHMKPAAAAQMKPATAAGSASENAWRPSEDQPLVVGNTMFVVTPYSRVVALDAATGREKWVFVIPGSDQASLRGAAYWAGDASSGPSLFFGTNHGLLYSISAATGKVNTTFGNGGAVNLRTAEVMSTGSDQLYILPSPPVIYKNLIITGAGPGEGHGGAGGGLGAAGDTRAWDIHTGKLVWTFHSVPRPGDAGHETWGGESWKQRSGVNVWGYMTVDQERGIVYMPFGAPNYDRVGTDRPGDNLFGSSVVAADAATGKLLWYFQVVHHDIWDYDTEAPPTLIDFHREGKTIPAVVVVNKTGLLFVLDRMTGKPLFPVVEKPVPASDVPGEHASPTQPFPVTPGPLAQTTVELYHDLPEHTAWCKAYVDDNHILLAQQPYTPPAFNRYSLNMPGTHGGVNFSGGAFDPSMGLFIVNVNNLGQPMRIVPDGAGGYTNSGPIAGTTRFWNAEKHLPCNEPPWGELVAVDVNSGNIAWRSVLGVTDTFPEGKQHTGRPGLGGPIVTASGLTFIGATDDARFRAFDTKTGRELWTYHLPASAESIPITYADEHGKQYVAIVATGGGLLRAPLLSDELIAFTLDDGSGGTENVVQASANPAVPQPSIAPPAVAGTIQNQDPKRQALLIRQAALLPAGPGRDITIRACSTCHGLDVVTNQRLTPQEWNNVVQTMSAKGAAATPAELNLIQSYLAHAFPRPGGKQNQGGGQEGVQQQNDKNTTPAQRAEATRVFLGLGAVPDKIAAARGQQLFIRNCAFCHGQQARGAAGPSLITSEQVLADDHGEHLTPFLRKGLPDKGMPAFASMADQQLTDIAEFLHLEVEEVANRGAYHVLNIVVGNGAKGKAFVEEHCMRCHTAKTFAQIASRFRSPDQLQRYWIWPSREAAMTASVKSPSGTVSGRVTRIDDFRISLVDRSGKSLTVDRGPDVDVQVHDVLAPHQEFLMTLANDDMHNVTAYLETLK